MTQYRYPKQFEQLRKRVKKSGSELAESAFAWFSMTKLEQGRNGKTKKHHMSLSDQWDIEVDGVPLRVSISMHMSIVEER